MQNTVQCSFFFNLQLRNDSYKYGLEARVDNTTGRLARKEGLPIRCEGMRSKEITYLVIDCLHVDSRHSSKIVRSLRRRGRRNLSSENFHKFARTSSNLKSIFRSAVSNILIYRSFDRNYSSNLINLTLSSN